LKRKKSEAIILAEEKFRFKLNNLNTHFSKVNTGKPVWWFEIPISKIDNPNIREINLLRNDQINLLNVPTKFFKDHFTGFKIRKNKKVICLELDINTLQNIVGSEKVYFKQFIK
jgi:hypothetical protein